MREAANALVFVAVWASVVTVLVATIPSVLPRPSSPERPVRAALVIVGDRWSLEYEGNGSSNTAFGLLREASDVQGFPLEWVDYGWPYDDVFVTSINGTRNDQNRNVWWQFCVNSAYASLGAVRQTVSDGDVVLWVYAQPGGSELCA